jgi:hypothetical protein
MRVDQAREQGSAVSLDHGQLAPRVRNAPIDGANHAAIDDDIHVTLCALAVENAQKIVGQDLPEALYFQAECSLQVLRRRRPGRDSQSNSPSSRVGCSSIAGRGTSLA